MELRFTLYSEYPWSMTIELLERVAFVLDFCPQIDDISVEKLQKP